MIGIVHSIINGKLMVLHCIWTKSIRLPMEETASHHWCKWKTEDWSWVAVFLTSRSPTTDTVTSVHRPKPPRSSYITYSRDPGTSWSKVMSRMLRPVFFLTVAYLARVQSYSGGPPASACDSMRPGPPHQVDMTCGI